MCNLFLLITFVAFVVANMPTIQVRDKLSLLESKGQAGVAGVLLLSVAVLLIGQCRNLQAQTPEGKSAATDSEQSRRDLLKKCLEDSGNYLIVKRPVPRYQRDKKSEFQIVDTTTFEPVLDIWSKYAQLSPVRDSNRLLMRPTLERKEGGFTTTANVQFCLLYTSPSPRDRG